jgi:4-hydroxy-tetrahydrodipicolinate synthase
MDRKLFRGVCTALVTPFLDNKVNYPMLEQLLMRQMDAGIEAVVICGTTGEASTLTDDEKIELFHRAKAYVGKEMLIIAGTGSNNTDHAVYLSQEAQKAGADALLIVSPYYNKATDEGLVKHYMNIAHSVKIPIILYNVPPRTGVDIPVSVYKRLATIPNIVGVKEASTNIEKVLRIKAACPKDFAVWSGNDALTVPVVSLGGDGVISVSSNLIPEEMSACTYAALDGDFDTAAALLMDMVPLLDLMFCEVNPIPIKFAMKCAGYDCGGCRLPLCRLKPENENKIKNFLS